MCWLHLYSLNFGFLLPVGILAVLNFILFVIVFSSLTCKKQQVRSSAQKRTSTQDFILAITLILMMGMTWIFGFLMLIAEDVKYQEIMAWLFTIVNSLQGFLIFLVNCVRNQNVRSLWLNPILQACGCGKCTKTTSSTTSTSNRSGTGQTNTRAKRSETNSTAM
uniref:CD97 antigen-like n=1 Tax=Phallusia mammillata TaxID=59560 RepID=A0A6F9D9C5_9ASCI|nr:CD97 antigen-like [Phallusia mammillata]